MTEVIAAFDPALWRTGWAVLRLEDGSFASLRNHEHHAFVAGGSIGSGRKTGRDAKSTALLGLLVETQIILLQCPQPDVVVIEKPGHWARASWKSSQESVEAMANARGVVMAVAGLCGIPCEELEVGVARQRILGNKTANKDQVVFALRALGLPILQQEDGTPDLDYCDAAFLAVASRWDVGRLARIKVQGA